MGVNDGSFPLEEGKCDGKDMKFSLFHTNLLLDTMLKYQHTEEGVTS